MFSDAVSRPVRKVPADDGGPHPHSVLAVFPHQLVACGYLVKRLIFLIYCTGALVPKFHTWKLTGLLTYIVVVA